jgi:hypothetical protein
MARIVTYTWKSGTILYVKPDGTAFWTPAGSLEPHPYTWDEHSERDLDEISSGPNATKWGVVKAVYDVEENHDNAR